MFHVYIFYSPGTVCFMSISFTVQGRPKKPSLNRVKTFLQNLVEQTNVRVFKLNQQNYKVKLKANFNAD